MFYLLLAGWGYAFAKTIALLTDLELDDFIEDLEDEDK